MGVCGGVEIWFYRSDWENARLDSFGWHCYEKTDLKRDATGRESISRDSQSVP